MSARRASAAALACILLGGFASPGPPQPQRLAEIPRDDFLAEGVAIAPDGALLVSGVQGRTVLRVVDGRVRPWLKGRAKGGLFGMAVDARRDRLWIAETAGPAVPGSANPPSTE